MESRDSNANYIYNPKQWTLFLYELVSIRWTRDVLYAVFISFDS